MRFRNSSVLFIAVVTILAVLLVIWGLGGSLGSSGIESYLRVDARLFCSKDDTDSTFSKNPPYFVGQKYYYWLRMDVIANTSVSNVVVSDQLGEALMINGIGFVPIDGPGPYNYTFVYGTYKPGRPISVTNGTYTWNGFLDENGVKFDNFVVYWTEDTLKVNFEWTIGSMGENATRVIYLTISSDTNAEGLQEFASPGKYLINTGAVVKGFLESELRRTIGEGNSIEIEVLEKNQ